VSSLDVDLSGIGLRLDGLTAALAQRISEDWAPFVAQRHDQPFLRLQLHFLDLPLPQGEFAPKAMTSILNEDSARFSMPEGNGTIRLGGRCEIDLVRGLGRREYFSLLNLLRACLAWLLPSRRAMLLHAAGLVVGGRAFLLVGSEGSGKSSWARIGEDAGAQVLSDDLVLVDGSAGTPEVLGSPFRSTHVADYRPGRWPLSAIFFPRHGEEAASSPADSLLAKARIVANMTFIAEAVGSDERIAPLLDSLTATVPCAELTFGLEPSFMEILRSWPER
jgi:hypothetical protein